jgi:hypothetical protein
LTVGASIFLLAAGAILRYAVQDEIEAVNLETVGLILMIAGALGLVIGLFMMSQARRRDAVVYERREPPPPPGY